MTRELTKFTVLDWTIDLPTNIETVEEMEQALKSYEREFEVNEIEILDITLEDGVIYVEFGGVMESSEMWSGYRSMYQDLMDFERSTREYETDVLVYEIGDY